MEKYVVFYNKNNRKELSAYSLNGTFAGEMESTWKLLADENNIGIGDITTKIEIR